MNAQTALKSKNNMREEFISQGDDINSKKTVLASKRTRDSAL